MGEELVLKPFEAGENRSGGYEFSIIGSITTDPVTEDLSGDPMVVIDGKGISWKEFPSVTA